MKEKNLRRLRKQRVRRYMSAFGPTSFRRDVYATRETQRQKVVPLEKNGQKRLACVGSVCSVASFRRAAEDVVNEILRQEKQTERPKPRNKRLRATLTREVDGQDLHAKDAIFDWLAKKVAQRHPRERRTVVAVMDGETKLRNLQQLKIGRAIGTLDIWHVTEYLWKLAYCFHPEGSDRAEAFVDTRPHARLASACWPTLSNGLETRKDPDERFPLLGQFLASLSPDFLDARWAASPAVFWQIYEAGAFN